MQESAQNRNKFIIIILINDLDHSQQPHRQINNSAFIEGYFKPKSSDMIKMQHSKTIKSTTPICLNACNRATIRIQNHDSTDPAITEFLFRERIFPSECNQLNVNCNSENAKIAIEFRNQTQIELQSTVAPIIIFCDPNDLQWHYANEGVVDAIYCFTPGMIDVSMSVSAI